MDEVSQPEMGDGSSRLAALEDVFSELQRIADRLAQRIGRPVDFDDAHLRLLAHSSHPQQIDAVRLASILNRSAPEAVVAHVRNLDLASAREPVRVAAVPELGMDARLCVPIRSSGTLIGFLWLLDDGKIDAAAIEAAVGAAGEAAELLERVRIARIGLLRRAQPLVLEVLEGERAQSQAALRTLVEEGLLLRADSLQVALLAERHRLLPAAAEHAGAGPEGRAGAAEAEAGDHGGAGEAIGALRRETAPTEAVFALAFDGLLVLSCLDSETFERVLERVLAERLALVAGIAAASDRPGAAALARRRARWAAEAAAGGVRDRALGRWERMGAYRYLSGFEERIGSLRDLEPAMCRLVADAGGQSLLQTLETFLDLAGSASATAASLNLHRSSLYHRLARAEAELGVDLHDGAQRLDMHIALKAARMQGLLDRR